MASITHQTPQTTMDFAALAQLRSRATTDSKAVTEEAARHFEALFVQMVLESMRSAGDVFGDGSDNTYRDMFDRQVALELSRGKGLGIAELLTRQLAPPGSASTEDTPRAVSTADFIAAREAALPSPPAAGVERRAPNSTGFQAATAAPMLDFTQIGTPWRVGDASPRSNWRPASQEEFIRDVWPLAQRAGTELGVDPRAIVAQAALETGWGRNVARDSRGLSGNNPFNIKADTRWHGERVNVRTLEFEQGMLKPQIASFRAYPNLPAAFADYVQFMKSNPRYSDALANGSEPERYAESLQKAGYATDPQYADKLRSILGSSRFNELIAKFKNPLRLPIL